jgi:hypothetical protein
MEDIQYLIKREVELYFLKFRDKRHTTYGDNLPLTELKLYSYIKALSTNQFQTLADPIANITQHYLDHRFNLLGSGWVQVKYGMSCQGLEGINYEMSQAVKIDPRGQWLVGRINDSNLANSQAVWRLVDNDYTPIDWQLDFKSGYRWSEFTWYKDIKYGQTGADVKVPWELSRMQHLSQLAWAFHLSTIGEQLFLQPEVYAGEFRNQVLDFIATNPPRFGVNWHSTMDVAIRVANWLMTYDLFNILGVDYDTEFTKIFIRSIYEHGEHISNNLEWKTEPRNNHYLANLAGLLFAAAYLKSTPMVKCWLAFAVQELLNEVSSQFYPEGTNVEASTAYHRLAAEIVVYATALVLGLSEDKKQTLRTYDYRLHKAKPPLAPAPNPMYLSADKKIRSPFPAWYFERLQKMAEFTDHITKPDGHVPQIGDNDSGRFFKFQVPYQKMTVADAKFRFANLAGYNDLPDDAVYWHEDHLDHHHLVAEITGLFHRNSARESTDLGGLEAALIFSLTRDDYPTCCRQSGQPAVAETVRKGTAKDLVHWYTFLHSQPLDFRQSIIIPIPTSKDQKIALYGYPCFGLYIFRSREFYLAIRCGKVGPNDFGRHAHNDHLSVELFVQGQDWIRDPGSYLYTPLPNRRNQYRSISAHFAPQLPNCEPSSLKDGLFRLTDEARTECLYFGEKGFAGRHHGFGDPIYRVIRLREKAIHMIDGTEGHTPLKDIYSSTAGPITSVPFSIGYGHREA